MRRRGCGGSFVSAARGGGRKRGARAHVREPRDELCFMTKLKDKVFFFFGFCLKLYFIKRKATLIVRDRNAVAARSPPADTRGFTCPQVKCDTPENRDDLWRNPSKHVCEHGDEIQFL